MQLSHSLQPFGRENLSPTDAYFGSRLCDNPIINGIVPGRRYL